MDKLVHPSLLSNSELIEIIKDVRKCQFNQNQFFNAGILTFRDNLLT